MSRLDPLLRPRSVVVIGASPNPSFVSSILKNLLRSGYSGQVAAVNPRYESVLEAPCYPSVLEVPWPVDLAVVGVAWRQFPTLLEQCEQIRVGALVVITSGFAESGGDGIARQAQLSEWAQRTGTPVCGPNCLGLLHVPSGLHALPSTFPQVVSGEVTPDRYRVLDGPVRARAAGPLRVLRDDEVQAVAALARRAEAAFDGPVDVEFCFERRLLWLVQARPITTLP